VRSRRSVKPLRPVRCERAAVGGEIEPEGLGRIEEELLRRVRHDHVRLLDVEGDVALAGALGEQLDERVRRPAAARQDGVEGSEAGRQHRPAAGGEAVASPDQAGVQDVVGRRVRGQARHRFASGGREARLSVPCGSGRP